MRNKIILVVILFLAAFIGGVIELSIEVIYFNAAAILLGYEFHDFWKFQKSITNAKTFQVKSDKWLIGIVSTAFVIFVFSNGPANLWKISSIILISVSGVLYVIRNRSSFYRLEENGIRNISNNQLIKVSKVKHDENEISFDSTEYENELAFNSDVLKSPSWDELTSELAKLYDTKANKELS